MDTSPAKIGDNTQTINYQQIEIERLAAEYPHLIKTVDELIAESSVIAEVDSQQTKDIVTSLVKKFRDAYKRVKGIHEPEKMPFLERGRGVDSFCFGLMDKIARRDKRANEGEADRLLRILTNYDIRIEAEERERRRLEAEKAARELREAEERWLEAERVAEEARLAAERARKPETQAVKEEAADEAAQEAAAARVENTVTEAKAEETHAATLASSADIMRQRNDQGVLSTMGTEKFREITDRNTLDLEKLRPYIAMDALEKALNKYADSVGYSSDESVQIKGARFGKRPKSRVL